MEELNLLVCGVWLFVRTTDVRTVCLRVGISSNGLFRLAWHERVELWKIDFCVAGKKEVPSDRGSFVFYESFSLVDKNVEKVVPFATWHCVEGKGPVPYAARRSSLPIEFNIGTN